MFYLKPIPALRRICQEHINDNVTVSMDVNCYYLSRDKWTVYIEI